jgi:DNA-binding response OmpR family regulator
MKNDSSILIVEDTVSCREPLAALLRTLGYKPCCAANGVEAIRVLESQTPLAIVLDINMPEMDGITLLRMMQGRSAWKRIPVIVLSSATDKTTVVAAAGLGVKEYVVKTDYKMADLVARLDRHVGQTVGTSGGSAGDAVAASTVQPDLVGDFEAPSCGRA